MTHQSETKTAPVLWDVRKVAEHLGVGVSTIWRWKSLGHIPEPMKIGGLVRWRREDIERFVSGQTAA